jgi:nucleotide-binding universal stress UspA family protein
MPDKPYTGCNMSDELDSPPKYILIATDGSQPSRTAARAAIQIAKKQAIAAFGLYVVGSRIVMNDGAALKSELNGEVESIETDDLVDQFRVQGDEALNWLEELCLEEGVIVSSEILFGGIPEMINERSKHASLLSIGRRGHLHGDDPLTLGENFRAALSHQSIPWLIGGELTTNFRRIWIILMEQGESEPLLSWGRQLQDLFSCDVLISAFQGEERLSEEASAAIEHFTKDSFISSTRVIGPIQSTADIINTLATYRVDLLVMEGFHRNILGRWPEKHPVEDILRKSEVMVLTV